MKSPLWRKGIAMSLSVALVLSNVPVFAEDIESSNITEETEMLDELVDETEMDSDEEIVEDEFNLLQSGEENETIIDNEKENDLEESTYSLEAASQIKAGTEQRQEYYDNLFTTSLTVTGTAEEAFAEGTLNAEKEYSGAEGETYKEVSKLLDEKYEEGYDLETVKYNEVVDNEGNVITFPSDAKYQVQEGFTSTDSKLKLYKYTEGTLVEITEFEYESDVCSFTLDKLGDTVYVFVGNLKEKKPVGTEQSQEYYDNLFTTSLTVTGTAEEAFAEGTLNAEKEYSGAEGETYKEVSKLLDEKYEEGYDLETVKYNEVVDNEGNVITFPSDAKYQVQEGFTSTDSKLKLYKYTEGTLVEITEFEYERDTCSFTLEELGDTVYVFAGNLKEKSAKGPAYGTFAEGTYTVTANLYIRGEDNNVLPGVTAYMTNPNLPPTTPMSNNSVMKVDKEGNITVTVNPINDIFTLQGIDGGTDAHIVNSVYGCPEGSTEEDWLQNTNGAYKGRYTSLEIQLDNMNGEYKFANCKQYPLILHTDKTMPMYLGVDFDSAIKKFTIEEGQKEYSKTYSQNGVSVEIHTTEETLGKNLETAVFSVSDVEKEQKEEIIENIAEYYTQQPTIELYKIHLQNADGNDLELNGNTQTMVSFDNCSEASTVYEVNEKTRVSSIVSGTLSENKLILYRKNLGLFAVDRNASSNDKLIAKTFTDKNTNSSVTVYVQSTDAGDLAQMVYVANSSDGKNGKTWKIGIAVPDKSDAYPLLEKSKVKFKLPASDGENKYYLIIDDGSSQYTEELKPSIKNGTATFTFSRSLGEDDDDSQVMEALFNGWKKRTPSSETPVAYILESSNKVVTPNYAAKYGKNLVYNGKDQNGILEDEAGLYTKVSGCTAKNAGTYNAVLELTDAAKEAGYVWSDGTNGKLNVTWTIDKKNLYIKRIKKTIGAHEKPKWDLSFEGFVDGENKDNVKLDYESCIFYCTKYGSGDGTWGVEPDENVYMPGNIYELITFRSKKFAENYYLTGHIIDGETHFNGGAQTYIISGLEIPQNASYPYTGNEIIGVADDEFYTVVSGNQKATEPGTYTVELKIKDGAKWEDGTSENKTVTWTIEKPDAKVTVPSANTGLVYNGAKQTGVAEGEGYILRNNTATDAGEYAARAILKDGYIWSDGSRESKEIKWSIAKKTVAVPSAKRLTYNGSTQTGVAAGNGYHLTGSTTAVNAGTYKATAVLDKNYKWSDQSEGNKVISWTIQKAKQNLSVKTAVKKYSYASLQKKAASFKIGASGVTYKITKTPAKASKYISVNKNGKVTLKKKAPAGTYVITVSKAGNINYEDAKTAVTIIVKKAGQKITAKNSAKKVKVSAVKKKAVSYTIGAKAKGSLSYQISSTPNNAGKYISVTKKGKVTLKKGAPKGTYVIRITAKETSVYKKATKNVKVTVK